MGYRTGIISSLIEQVSTGFVIYRLEDPADDRSLKPVAAMASSSSDRFADPGAGAVFGWRC
jgi:hypothetical protein